jgi:hypothetical protein
MPQQPTIPSPLRFLLSEVALLSSIGPPSYCTSFTLQGSLKLELMIDRLSDLEDAHWRTLFFVHVWPSKS